MNKLLILIVSLLVLSSCYNDNEEDLYGLECVTEELTYVNELERVISSSCATSGCHDAGAVIGDYTNYNNIKADSGIIFERAIVQKDMPKGFALSDCDFKLLQNWIEQGAQE
ncbi:MAG: hypothetical protein ACI8ZX_000871 [Planctomycetota bacterium]|jgi:hypothetical protein